MTRRRIAIVASELLGRPGTGGAGTADCLLAVALARHGHEVLLLMATGRDIGEPTEDWASEYASAGVRIRVLEDLAGVRPAFLRPALEVFHALREDPPHLAIVNDWRALGWAALQARAVGVALADTTFVVHCHGPARWLAECSRKVPDTLERFGVEVAERASVGLADAVVSPSGWLLDWMRTQAWPVPESAIVIPYVREPTALGNATPKAPTGSRVGRVAFFGPLREGKGIRVHLAALDALDPALLADVELLFLGPETRRWTAERIANSLSPAVTGRVSGVRIETGLDRATALEELRQPGTLAVMPSILDNSPNTVSECIEQGIPFISTRTGGVPELVREEDRDRVLCQPTSADLAAALTRALSSPDGFEPARSAHDPAESLRAWLDLVEAVAPPARVCARTATRVSLVSANEESARRMAERTRTVEVEVVPATTRQDGLARASAEWVVFLDRDDNPDDALVDRLVQAQAASDADVVTCAVRPGHRPGGIQLFLGHPGSLGLVENQYGVLGIVRRALLDDTALPESGADPDWVLFARLALGGARIVSIPDPLSVHQGSPGIVGDVPGDGLTVLETFEACGTYLRDLPQLAATLAAANARSRRDAEQGTTSNWPRYTRRLGRRVLKILSVERR
jgi:glycosyltransferase involved in cell wall biosynthesis